MLLRELAVQISDHQPLEPLIPLDFLRCHYLPLGKDTSSGVRKLANVRKAVASLLGDKRVSSGKILRLDSGEK